MIFRLGSEFPRLNSSFSCPLFADLTPLFAIEFDCQLRLIELLELRVLQVDSGACNSSSDNNDQSWAKLGVYAGDGAGEKTTVKFRSQLPLCNAFLRGTRLAVFRLEIGQKR